MAQSKLCHTAIIMDGNGRWARQRGWPRSFGHREGSRAVRRIIEAAPRLGIGILTLYAFSSDNWNRPRPEIDFLMGLLRQYLRDEAERCHAAGMRVRLIGRRDRLPEPVVEAAEYAEALTRSGGALDLRLAVDYSARDSILRSAIGEDVDLLIRTGGEQRLSDFLLWECAYAELVFVQRLWPDFTAADLGATVREYRARERRFGRITEAVSPSAMDIPAMGTNTSTQERWLR